MNIINALIIFILLCCDDVKSARVRIEEGWLEGQILMTTPGKRKYYSFKGIPYAESPVGKLRFGAPRPPFNWEGIRNATEHGSVCVQINMWTKDIIGDEDCLFLNVYSPNIYTSTPAPVMFYIHGGYFKDGSGNGESYAPDFLVSHDVVLVTINFRLDVLGFFAVNSEKASGNAGLKDQIAALQWVKRNIRSFGGDPDRVTIFGHSTGSISVSLHIVSPTAKGLFHRAIAMGGVYLKYWATAFEPEKRALTLARKLGVKTNDTESLIECLQQMPAKKLFSTRPDIILSDNILISLGTTQYFLPVVEKKFGEGRGQFLTGCPNSLIRKRQVNRVDLLIGYTALEGLTVAPYLINKFLKYYPNYKELLVPLRISYFQSLRQVLKLADQIQEFYFGNQTISLKTIKNLVTYFSYSDYVYDIHAYIESLPKFQSRRYFYKFAIYSTRNYYSKPGAMKFGIKQASHKDEVLYLFDGSSYNLTVDVNGQAYKYVQLMTKLYTNFAKYGTPTPDESLGLVWPQYDPNRSYVLIGENGTLSTGTVSYSTNTSIGFWRQLYSSVGIYP